MNSRIDQVVDMGVGAGLMYFFDPERGRQRRNQLGDRATEQATLAAHAAGDAGQQVLAAVSTATGAASGAGQQALRQARGALGTATGAARQAPRRANLWATGLVPTARLALARKLAMDEMVLEQARKELEKQNPRPRLWRAGGAGLRLGGILALLAAAAFGAGLMFLVDRGMERRRRMQWDETTHTQTGAGGMMGNGQATLRNPVRDAAAEVRPVAGEEPISDEVLFERVRADLAGAGSDTGSIQVAVHQGRVVLTGPIPAGEVERLLDRVRSVPGVRSVENHLEVSEAPGRMSDLRG